MTKHATGLRYPLFVTAFMIAATVFLASRFSTAQTTNPAIQGDNATYYTAINPPIGGSVALVDAKMYYANNNSDICQTIHSIVTNAYSKANSSGVVVDARGINAASGTPLTCLMNPFDSVDAGGFGITVLLPASTIGVTKSWILPNAARVIGEGQGLTILQATGGFDGSQSYLLGDIVDLGVPPTSNPPAVCGSANNGADCIAIGVEHLTVDANNLSLKGIVDGHSQELTYVKDVGIVNIASGGIGLYTEGANSGPYSDIYYSGAGTCAKVFRDPIKNSIGSTRGIHGLTCSGSANPGAAITLDAPNATLEDINISGFGEGILVGSLGRAQADVIRNATGGSGVNKVIHISGTMGNTSNCPPGTQNQAGNPNGTNVAAPYVCDLTVLGVASAGTNSIYDDLTGAHLTDSNVAIYALGEQSTVGSIPAYSRFTTSSVTPASPAAPAWFVGAAPTAGSSCSANGSLYSATSGSHTIWGCVGQHWTAITTP